MKNGRSKAQEIDLGNGFCNTAMACRIFGEIRKYEGVLHNLENGLRGAARRGEIQCKNVGTMVIWNIDSLKKYGAKFVEKYGEDAKGRIKGFKSANKIDIDNLMIRFRQIIREEIQAAFK